VRETVAILVGSLVDAVIGGDYRNRRDIALTADMRAAHFHFPGMHVSRQVGNWSVSRGYVYDDEEACTTIIRSHS
jgi:hypothetical protein